MGYPDFSNYTLATFNQTLIENNNDLCTLQICPLVLDGVPLAHISYLPSMAGNILFTAIFGLLVALQVFLGIKYRTWGFMVGMLCGGLLEVIGYVARVQMHSNPFTDSHFIMYLCCLTIAPAFLSASIYLCLSRLMVIYTPVAARFKPQTYTYIFIGCDFVSLLLQAAGGALASIANTLSEENTGIHIMVAGVAFQVASLGIFFILCADYYIGLKRTMRNSSSSLNPNFASIRSSLAHKLFVWALSFAAIFIFVRSIFRCLELNQGFHGRLANQEVTFMVLDGAMVILAISLLTMWHPGQVWGHGAWAAVSFKKEKVVSEKKWTSKMPWNRPTAVQSKSFSSYSSNNSNV